jgi:hypothetical protein
LLSHTTAGGYGQCLVWDIPAVYAPPSTGHEGAGVLSYLPLARIKETLGTGIAREDVVFDAESNALLVCLNERKIR